MTLAYMKCVTPERELRGACHIVVRIFRHTDAVLWLFACGASMQSNTVLVRDDPK
jgi:hypothetical protein